MKLATDTVCVCVHEHAHQVVGTVNSDLIYLPMSCAMTVTGRLYIHNRRLASTRMSIREMTMAISGASGNDAANS